jgi:hypothetical protein
MSVTGFRAAAHNRSGPSRTQRSGIESIAALLIAARQHLCGLDDRSAAVLVVVTFLAIRSVLPALAAEPDRSEPATASDSWDLRRNNPELSGPRRWFGSIGAAHTRAEDRSRTWSTPFFIDYKLDRDTTFTLEGDGYSWISADGATAQGFNNLTLIASQVVYRDEASRLRLSAGATSPGTSGIGSRGSRQRISANYRRYFGEHWTAGLSARLIRRNEALRPGEDRVERYGRLETVYTFDESQPAALVLELERKYRRGAGGSTDATVRYEFPLTRTLGASLGFTRGLTTGLRDNTFAVDLLFSF